MGLFNTLDNLGRLIDNLPSQMDTALRKVDYLVQKFDGLEKKIIPVIEKFDSLQGAISPDNLQVLMTKMLRLSKAIDIGKVSHLFNRLEPVVIDRVIGRLDEMVTILDPQRFMNLITYFDQLANTINVAELDRLFQKVSSLTNAINPTIISDVVGRLNYLLKVLSLDQIDALLYKLWALADAIDIQKVTTLINTFVSLAGAIDIEKVTALINRFHELTEVIAVDELSVLIQSLGELIPIVFYFMDLMIPLFEIINGWVIAIDSFITDWGTSLLITIGILNLPMTILGGIILLVVQILQLIPPKIYMFLGAILMIAGTLFGIPWSVLSGTITAVVGALRNFFNWLTRRSRDRRRASEGTVQSGPASEIRIGAPSEEFLSQIEQLSLDMDANIGNFAQTLPENIALPQMNMAATAPQPSARTVERKTVVTFNIDGAQNPMEIATTVSEKIQSILGYKSALDNTKGLEFA